MSTTHLARIFFILAREANKAVVFRRGPTKWTQMSVWNLNDDTLEFGQWSKIKLRPRRCDLSPSGKHLIYFDDQFEENSTTAISKPPFWNALCKWKREYSGPNLGYGGGLFASETELHLNFDINDEFEGNLPSFLKVSELPDKHGDYSLWKGHINPLLEIRMKRDGWEEVEDKEFIKQATSNKVIRKPSKTWSEIAPDSKKEMEPKLFEKKITNNSFLRLITYYHSDLGKTINLFYLRKRTIKTKLEGFEWADIDHPGRIVAAKEGQLFASKQLKDGSVQLANLEMLHDLNPQQPTNLLVPDEMKKW